jgi:hypothetical protein
MTFPSMKASAAVSLTGYGRRETGLESLDYGRRESVALTTRHLSIRKSWH